MPSSAQPRVAIIGAGAMGSSLAAVTSTFAPTVLVCRNPKRAAELFAGGIHTHGEFDADARPVIVPSAADLASIGGVTYLFIATKTTAIDDVCRELEPLRHAIAQDGADVRLISYQNGIQPGARIMDMLGTTSVMRMVLNYAAMLKPDGSVEVVMHQPPNWIGCVDDKLIADCDFLARSFTNAGFETRHTPDIEPYVWAKAIINAAYNPVCALVNASVGQVNDAPAAIVAKRLLDEGIAVAEAVGIKLPTGYRGHALSMADAGTHHLPSMVADITSGRPSEIGQLNRQIINRAHEHGVPVPTHEVIDALIETFDWRVYHNAAR